MRSSERRETMDFMIGLMHGTAKKSDKTQIALKWIHLLVEILAWKWVRNVKKALKWLPIRVLILTSKVGQCIRNPLQWHQQDARKDDDTIEWLQKSNPPDLSLTNSSKEHGPAHRCEPRPAISNSEILVKAAGAQYRDLDEGTPCEVWKVRNLKGNNALQEALKKGHGEVVLYPLDSYHEELGHVVNGAGESPLYLAAEAGLLIHVVRRLIAGKDYSVEGPDGQTPLHIAVIKGHLDIVETLLEECERIDPKKADWFGRTAFHYAAALGYGKIMVSLVSTTPRLCF
ncbi:hypothetical protein AAC387_Pa10g0864 [Persea americana]